MKGKENGMLWCCCPTLTATSRALRAAIGTAGGEGRTSGGKMPQLADIKDEPPELLH